MSAQSMLMPGQKTPALSLPTLNGETWTLGENSGDDFTLLIFYRGYHCPACRNQMNALKESLAGFAERKASVVAVSMDPKDRFESTIKEWEMGDINTAYGLTAEQAREWGLYLSSSRGKTSIGIEELKIFNEPGMFLIRSDGTLFAAWVQSVPFARPAVADVMNAIDFINKVDYPPRGTVAV